MKTAIKYIEQKSDGVVNLNEKGHAVIAEVQFSKTGTTIYYQGKTFVRSRGIYGGNYRCREDENEYWISGVKKRGSNRHPCGSGPVETEISEEKLAEIKPPKKTAKA